MSWSFGREEAQPLRKPQLVPSRRPPATTLLVEDNENLRDLLCRTLEAKGFSVYAAADSGEALRLWQDHEGAIDPVVSDVVLPGANGIELAER